MRKNSKETRKFNNDSKNDKFKSHKRIMKNN